MIELQYKNVSKTINALPTSYVVLDFETTGLNATHDKIIEVSILKFDNGDIVDRFVTLINPLIRIPKGITHLTGISNDMVQDKPTIADCLPFIVEFIGDSTIIGHNINFDLRFLKEAYKKDMTLVKNIEYCYIDTLSLARMTIFETPNHRLETLKRYLHIDEISHRAEQDCLVTNQLYEYCKRKLGK